MAERYAVKTGNWNDVSVWDGGATFPGASDDVYANTYTVTINISVTCVCLHTDAGATAAAGGGFITSGVVTVTSDSRSGTTACLTVEKSAVQIGNSTSTGTATGTLARYGGLQKGNSQGGTGSGGIGTTCVYGGVQIGNAIGGSGTATQGTYAYNGGIFVGNATGGIASGGVGVLCDAGGRIFILLATGTVNLAWGVRTIAGAIAYILAEAGDYPKTIGADTDTTLANWPMGWAFVPAVGDVKAGVTFNAGLLEGTYDPMAAAVFPAAADVNVTDVAYGPTGAEYAGTLDLAGDYTLTASIDYPAVSNVLTTDTVNGEAGTYVAPVQASVLCVADGGTTYGATAVEGQATLPLAANVQSGAADYGVFGALRDPAYPTTATSKAEQLAVDQAEVTAKAGSIFETETILSIAGTLTAASIAASCWAYADRSLTG